MSDKSIEEKIAVYPFWVDRRLTTEEWENLKIWKKENPDLKFVNGDDFGDRVFGSYSINHTNGFHFKNKVKVKGSISLLEKYPEAALWLVNNEDGKISHGSKNKIWFKCINCLSGFDMSAVNFGKGNQRCPYCRGLRVNETNHAYSNQKMKDESKDKEILKTVTQNSHKLNTWVCNKCNSEYITSFNAFYAGSKCSYCCSAPKKINEYNMAYNNLDMLEASKNKEILRFVTCGSNKLNIWICKKCNSEYESAFKSFYSGVRCGYCCIAPRKINESNYAYKNEEMRKWAKKPRRFKICYRKFYDRYRMEMYKLQL